MLAMGFVPICWWLLRLSGNLGMTSVWIVFHVGLQGRVELTVSLHQSASWRALYHGLLLLCIEWQFALLGLMENPSNQSRNLR
jgi:hypothetical protein